MVEAAVQQYPLSQDKCVQCFPKQMEVMFARVVLKNILTSNAFFYTNILVLWSVECLLCIWSAWCARTKGLVKCIQKLKFPCVTTLTLGQHNDNEILASCHVTASESTFFPMMAEILNLRNPPMKLTTLSNY